MLIGADMMDSRMSRSKKEESGPHTIFIWQFYILHLNPVLSSVSCITVQ